MSHLTGEARKKISNMLSHGASCKDIANAIGCDPTTISKEIKRNRLISKEAKGDKKILCKKLDRFPFVCLDCPHKYTSCTLTQLRYNSEFAQKKYEYKLHESRKGINLTKYKDKEHKCTSPHIDESRLKEMCLEVINQVITNKKAIINDFELVKEVLFKPIDENQLHQVEDEIKIIDELIKKHMEKATDSSVSHEAYLSEYESLVKRHNDAESRYNALIEENEMRKTKFIAITSFIEALKKTKELPLQFDESLVNKSIQKMVVTNDGFVLFVLRNGKEIKLVI